MRERTPLRERIPTGERVPIRVVIGADYPEDPPNPVGGIQAIVYNTVEYLRRFGDLDLHVVTCEKWRSAPLDRERTTDDRGVTVHYLTSSPRIPHTLSMRTVDRWAVRRQIEQLAPDLVHVHGQAAAYALAALDARLPTLVTIQGINTLEAQVDRRGGALLSGLRIALWGSAERRCLRRATDVVVQGPFVRRFAAQYATARLHLIENPVHDAFFRIDPDPQPGRVLLVGSIQKRKGTLEAIKAMKYVRQQVPHAHLVLAGGFLKPYRRYGDMIRQVVADSQADAYVHFMGHLGQKELLEAHRTSQVFLFPTYLEGSPMALAEAMTSGLPSVVSDIESTAHLVEDGVTGYRVPTGDIKAFAESITRLLLDDGTRHRFARRAREIASERFTQELAARKTHDLYLALCRNPSPRLE